MKRILSLLLVMVLILTLAVGCSKPKDADGDETPDTDQTDAVEDEGTEEPASGNITKVGLGHVASIAKSKDAEEDEAAVAQADLTIAAVGFDEEGKVVSVTIDTAQTKVEFDEDLKVASDRAERPKSKKELKEDYGMKSVSEQMGIGKEWYEQIEALEEWMVGKTVDEIKNMKVVERDEAHIAVPDEPDLTSSVTITVESYIDAVAEAWENTVDVENGATVGLGLITSIGNSKDPEDGNGPVARMDTTMTATAFDEEGVVVGTIIDTAQIKVEYDAEGKVISDKDAEIKTKHELKEDYGMKSVSEQMGIGKEWYEQMNALQEWMVGKTVDEIVNMKVVERDEDHPAIPDEPDLTSSVTITVEAYLEVVELASKAAK